MRVVPRVAVVLIASAIIVYASECLSSLDRPSILASQRWVRINETNGLVVDIDPYTGNPAGAVLVTKIDGRWREVPVQSQVAIQLLADLAAGNP
jgi:hypothetical protein